ncbi:CDP-archaeol synthase, partial [Jeotgalibaca porci]
VGALLGVAYILFELPNSFIKRRMNISPGKAAYVTNPWKYMWLDQMDSLFGCALVLWLFYPLSFGQYLGYVFLGAATHLGINVILVKIGWKKAI